MDPDSHILFSIYSRGVVKQTCLFAILRFRNGIGAVLKTNAAYAQVCFRMYVFLLNLLGHIKVKTTHIV